MRILVVDDSEDWRDITQAALASAGYEDVQAVGSAEEAYAELQLDTLSTESRSPYDLIVLDVVMPQIDGIEACAQIRSHPTHADVPILVVTAVDDVDGLASAFAAGASDYITKPFNRVELLARVRSALKTKAELDRRHAHALELVNGGERMSGNGSSPRWIDATTGLFVGEVAEAYLSATNGHAKDQQLSVLALAIDGYEAIEAALGDDATENLLSRVAEEVCNAAASVDTIAAAYLDGVIVLVAPRVASAEARQFGETIRAAIAAAAIENPRSRGAGPVSISVGVITARAGQGVDAQFIDSARSVLRAAAAEGGNRVLTVDLSCT